MPPIKYKCKAFVAIYRNQEKRTYTNKRLLIRNSYYIMIIAVYNVIYNNTTYRALHVSYVKIQALIRKFVIFEGIFLTG